MISVLTLFLACADAPVPAPAPLLEMEGRLESPQEGVTIRAPWIPVLANFPPKMKVVRVALLIDGVDRSDPLALISGRWSAKGGGLDYLSQLDMYSLGPGRHELELKAWSSGLGAPYSMRSSFTVDPPPCRLSMDAVDEQGRAVDARVILRKEEQPVVLGSPSMPDPVRREQRLDSHFLPGGRGELRVDPGRWRFIATRGIRQDIDEVELDIGPGCAGARDLRFELPEVVATPGWRSADLHVHTGRSGDSFVPDRARWWSVLAADLDIAVITDHNRVVDATEAMAEVLQGRSGTQLISGIEDRLGEKGDGIAHMNFFPLSAEGSVPPTDSEEPSVHMDQWALRAQRWPQPESGARHLSQLNHPRGLQILPEEPAGWRAYALFTARGLQRKKPLDHKDNVWLLRSQAPSTTRNIDFDALELLNRFSWRQYLQVRQDWFLFLNLGHFHTGTGNSDSHALAVEQMGYPVNLIWLPGAREGEAVAMEELIGAIEAAQLSVSNGPIVEVTARSVGQRAAVGGRLELPAGEPVVLDIQVRAAPWVPVHELRVVANGEVVHREAIEPWGQGRGPRVKRSWSFTPERDTWVVVEAGWPVEGPPPTPEQLGPYLEVAPGHVPVGFTNPIRLDLPGPWQPLSYMEAADRTAPVERQGGVWPNLSVREGEEPSPWTPRRPGLPDMPLPFSTEAAPVEEQDRD